MRILVIPYIFATVIRLGPIPIQVWGFFVAFGLLVGGWMAARRAKEKGMSPQVVWDAIGWVVLSALVGARLFHIFVYFPRYYLSRPAEWLAVWDGGFSFIGGLIAAVLAGIWFLRKRKLDVLAYADVLVFGIPFGYTIGRIGCFLIHDHPGIPTTFFLGVQYPDGIIRHDLGLYELLNGFGLLILFWIFRKKEQRTGWFVVAALLWYGIARFFLDFFRIGDTRYFSITPAQWISVVMIIIGAAIARKYVIARIPKAVEVISP